MSGMNFWISCSYLYQEREKKNNRGSETNWGARIYSLSVKLEGVEKAVGVIELAL